MGNAPTAMVKLESMAAGREGIALLSRSFPNINARKILAHYLLGHIGWIAAVPYGAAVFLFLKGQGVHLLPFQKQGRENPPPFLLLHPTVRLDSGIV